MKKALLTLLLTTLLFTACSKKNTQDPSELPDTPTESSAVSEKESAATYQLSIPKDFSKLDIEDLEFYYAAQDGSSISLGLQPKDPDFSQITAKQLDAALADALLQTYKEDIVITDNYFTRDPVSGYPAYQYSISYQLPKSEVTQIIIGIDADQTYTFTYTDLTGTWIHVFEDSIQSITLSTNQ